jgi:hypothetical protein
VSDAGRGIWVARRWMRNAGCGMMPAGACSSGFEVVSDSCFGFDGGSNHGRRLTEERKDRQGGVGSILFACSAAFCHISSLLHLAEVLPVFPRKRVKPTNSLSPREAPATEKLVRTPVLACTSTRCSVGSRTLSRLLPTRLARDSPPCTMAIV